MCRSCSDPQFKLAYTPLEAALRWCGLFAMEGEILQAEWMFVEQLFVLFPQWHQLGTHVAMILDAIHHREIAWHSQDLVTGIDRGFDPAAIRIRHSDLKRWMGIAYPGQKPPFLFGTDAEEDCNVRIGVYLAMKAERDLVVAESRKLQIDLAATDKRLAELNGSTKPLAPRKRQQEPDHTFLMGAILAVVLGKKSSAKGQPCFATQDALVSAIQERFPGHENLSKRTIDQRFSEANKRVREKE